MQFFNLELKKKKKKKKRKMVNDVGFDVKKVKIENKGEFEEENVKIFKEIENNVEKLDNDEDDSEVFSLFLGLIGVFEDILFVFLCNFVSENILKVIKEMGFINMIEIQYKSIRLFLEGRDFLVVVKIGSGKILVFFIFVVEFIVKLKFMFRNGMGVFIFLFIRELVM